MKRVLFALATGALGISAAFVEVGVANALSDPNCPQNPSCFIAEYQSPCDYSCHQTVKPPQTAPTDGIPRTWGPDGM